MRLKDMVFLSMLAALTLVSVFVIKIPIMPSAPFLRFDIKDSIVMIGGCLYGPGAAFGVSFIVGLLQLMLIGESGIIGFMMNLLSTTAFVCTASAVYRLKRTHKGLMLGLACGVVLMTASMMLWNYIITPIFMGVPREAVASMLLPVFLPFNVMKGGINMLIVILYVRPLMRAASALKFYDNDKQVMRS